MRYAGYDMLQSAEYVCPIAYNMLLSNSGINGLKCKKKYELKKKKKESARGGDWTHDGRVALKTCLKGPRTETSESRMLL